MRCRDVVVCGGGLAGGAAAILLARAGLRVVLAEKTRGPHHKVCGEFLSTEAVAILTRLGIDLPALGAVPIAALGLPRGERTDVAGLPFPAMGLSRLRLDEAVLDLARASGAEIRRGAAVRAVRRDGTGTSVEIAGGVRIGAAAVIAATGKHDLPGRARPAGRQPGLIGFKMHLRTSRALDARVDLIGLPGGYAGLQPVEDGIANLCLLVGGRELAAAGGWSGLFARLRATTPALSGAEPLWPKPVAVARIPYGFVRREAAGIHWLGDQAAVIPSFSGDGMSIALHSAVRACDAVLAGRSAEDFQAAFADEVAGQVGRATLLSRLMVRPWFQGAARAVAAAAPGLVARIAVSTRVAAALP